MGGLPGLLCVGVVVSSGMESSPSSSAAVTVRCGARAREIPEGEGGTEGGTKGEREVEGMLSSGGETSGGEGVMRDRDASRADPRERRKGR